MIHEKYISGEMGGWNPDKARDGFKQYGSKLPKFKLYNQKDDYRGKRRMLWETTRKVIGSDTEPLIQAIGDCVSFSGKHVLEYLICTQIIIDGLSQKFRPIYAPYFYGTSRVLVGGGQLGNSDGSCGSWLQEAAKRFGVLASDENGVPKYSGQVAKQWGYSGPPKQFVEVGSKEVVKTTAICTNAEDAANAIYAGHPISVCSNRGYNMEPSSDGFHHPNSEWNHGMGIIGFEDHPTYGLYFIVLNNWGDVHGHLKDFSSDATLPISSLRVKGEYVNDMLSQKDSYIYSAYDGFPDNSDKLNDIDFKIFGVR